MTDIISRSRGAPNMSGDLTPERVAELLGDDGVYSCPTPMCNGSYGWQPIEWNDEPCWHTHCGCGWLNNLVPQADIESREVTP